MKTSFSIGNQFQSKWHQERASRYSVSWVEHKLFVFTRVKGFLLKLPKPAASVSRHHVSTSTHWRLFFPQRSCSPFLSYGDTAVTISSIRASHWTPSPVKVGSKNNSIASPHCKCKALVKCKSPLLPHQGLM